MEDKVGYFFAEGELGVFPSARGPLDCLETPLIKEIMVSVNGGFRRVICDSNLATPTIKLKVRDLLMCKQRCYIYLLRYVAPPNSGNRGLHWRRSLCLEGSSRNVLLVRENRINPASINVTRVAIGC